MKEEALLSRCNDSGDAPSTASGHRLRAAPMTAPLKTLFLAIIALSQLACQAPLMSLAEIYLDTTHPVKSIDDAKLYEILTSARSRDYLLFDTRSPAEFQTSRIATAIRLDAEISADDFIAAYGDRIRDKHLVFYCSVGYRSSISIERLHKRARAAGALSLENLRGGIFRWYNERYPVSDGTGQTDKVHPVSSFWRILLRESNQPEPVQ